MSTETVDRSPPLRARLRAALPAAMKTRDRHVDAAVRSALGAIDNAEAIEIGDARAGAIEDSVAGLGGAEVERRQLSEADIQGIVRAEIAERLTSAASYDELGRADRGEVLRAEADALIALL
ncbi:hypothetical protein ABZV58_07550 [Nocardia sp. NPDC004654]|uniref:hypothetical protein n=1 Tax=Nocardia sp. NPDC004654 TaxID=3154776 RepID=UPI0033AC5C5C